jgi:2,5-diketo-D-gluconate reductase A
MSATVPHFTLNSGHQIPQLGLGVFQVEADVAKRVVLDALEIGYRHIDGAWIYRNEEGVGEAIAESGIPREELFVTTKLWNTLQGATTARDAITESLDKLGLDYVDLYLIHWPAPERNVYVESWLALEEFHAEGLARSIGVSNFLPEHLEKVLAAGSIVPCVNQIELHPAFQQKAQRAFQEKHGILTQSWGPLGQGKYDLSELQALADIAEETGKTLAQVALRWHIQEGFIVFPKSIRRERLQENFELFDFELTEAQMEKIRAADLDRRGGIHPLDGNW